MMSKRESASQPGNTKPKTRLRDKIRWKHKDESAVQTDPQPSACDEGSKVSLVTLLPCLLIELSYNDTDLCFFSKPQTLTQVPLETSDPGPSEDRKHSLLQGNDDQNHDMVLNYDSSLPEDLWKNAYEALKARDRDLVEDYTLCLAALNDVQIDCAQTSLPDFTPNEINNVVKKRLDYFEKKQLMIHLRGKPIKVREQGEKVIRFILWSHDFISTALSAQPYAALAWSGVSILLPVSCAMIQSDSVEC